jgi:hypothetical protein
VGRGEEVPLPAELSALVEAQLRQPRLQASSDWCSLSFRETMGAFLTDLVRGARGLRLRQQRPWRRRPAT